MRRNNGITLVALIITIIIVLILAGITIGQLTENGIFENAKMAKEKWKDAQELENNILSGYFNENQFIDTSARDDEITRLSKEIEDLKKDLANNYTKKIEMNDLKDYSETETEIGTYNNKTVYRKTFTTTTPKANADNWISIGCTIEDLINLYGYVETEGGYFGSLSIIGAAQNTFDNYNVVWVDKNHQDIGFDGSANYCSTDEISRKAVVTIEYTRAEN